jgi:hypothetical protein
MAPVSRRRKTRKNKAGKTLKTARPTPPQPATPPSRPTLLVSDDAREQSRRWWRPSIEGILADADQLTGATGPRELEQAVAELLGGRLHRALETEKTGFALLDWLATLIDAAGKAATGKAGRTAHDPDGLRYLLVGISALAPHPLGRIALRWIGRLGGSRAGDPEWLAATGGVVPASEVHMTESHI